LGKAENIAESLRLFGTSVLPKAARPSLAAEIKGELTVRQSLTAASGGGAAENR
jgi:hypothetical protein